MEAKCFKCYKGIIVGRDLSYSLTISYRDIISNDNIFFNEPGLKQGVIFCEDCRDVSRSLALELCRVLSSLEEK